MGFLALVLAYVVGPVLVIGGMNWILSGFPLPGAKKRKGFPDNGFLIFLGGAAMILPALAYLLFGAHFVFAWIATGMAGAFGAA